MGATKLPLSLRFYGMSPWEMEVSYSLFHSVFEVEEHPQEEQEGDFTTMIDIAIPLAFNDAFFKWFGGSRWDKLKAILKEFKRRRGKGKTILVYIKFSGKPNIKFMIDLDDKGQFDTAVDKIDFVLELLPYHLDPHKMPSDITEILYHFDASSGRWGIGSATGKGTYQFSQNEWKVI
jgi:hypothetical protein